MGKVVAKNLDEPLVVDVGLYHDGCVYALNPRTRIRMREAFPEGRRIPKVILDYEKQQDFERIHAPFWEQIGLMLTGLTAEQIGQLGGLRLYDPVEKRILWEWKPTRAKAQ